MRRFLRPSFFTRSCISKWAMFSSSLKLAYSTFVAQQIQWRSFCLPSGRMSLNYADLIRGDDVTSNKLVEALRANPHFETLSVSEGEDIKTRDDEDAKKLAEGVAISVQKGVISKDHGAGTPIEINVTGKSADEVADVIVKSLPEAKGEGSVVVLVGLSGTGKGTTVKKLQSLLPNVITWSNGNAFRALTHLIVTEVGKKTLESADVTSERVQHAISRLSFKEFEDEKGPTFDVVIDDTIRVSHIQNTTLKEKVISCNVPTVAEQTQGEVILFASRAVETLRSHGFNVILEGRAQTLNYIPTEHRFELVMPEVRILGQRRAAQRVIARALESLQQSGKVPEVSDADIISAVEAAVAALSPKP